MFFDLILVKVMNRIYKRKEIYLFNIYFMSIFCELRIGFNFRDKVFDFKKLMVSSGVRI